jgi:hypothetical protein
MTAGMGKKWTHPMHDLTVRVSREVTAGSMVSTVRKSIRGWHTVLRPSSRMAGTRSK